MDVNVGRKERKKGVGGHKRCCYGLCKSDSRTKAYYEFCNFYFIPFPKPCLQFRRNEIKEKRLQDHIRKCKECERSDKWVKLCGRRDNKFNSINKVRSYTYICSLHFVGEAGPSEQYPDPEKFGKRDSEKHKVRKVRTNLEDKYQHFLINNKEKEEVPRKEGVPKTEENVVKLESTDVEFQELRLLSSEKDDELIIPDAEMVSLSNTVSFDTQFETIPQSNNVSIDTQFETIGDSNKASVGTQIGIEAASESAFQKYKSNVKVRSVCTQTSKNMLREVQNKEECKMTCSILTENLKSPVEHFEKSLEKDEQKCLFYTGLRFQQILILLSFLGPASNNLIYWNSTRKADVDEKYKAKRKFTPLQELLLVLTRLRCGFLLEDMSYRFEVSVGLLSSINITWIQFMYQEFSKQLRPRMFVLKEQVAKYLPAIFKSFKNLRVILDCTEFFCEAPANFEHQGNLYSHYKGHTTFKVLIGCTPNGGISFVSEVYEGSISDREIVIKSKLPEYLLPGDVVLADRGFTIHDLLEEVGAYLNIPPFLRNRNRFTAQEKIVTKKIANERIYVERVVGRLKQFRILQRTIPLNMRGIISQIVFVCACLVNFQDPIVFDEK